VGAVAIDGESLWDSGHAWCEVFLHWGWVASDPTWGNGMFEEGKDIDAYWASLETDKVIPSVGRPTHITTGSIISVEGYAYGELDRLEFDELEEVSVEGEGFAGPSTVTHTREMWVVAGVTIFLGSTGLSFLLYRRIKRSRMQREIEASRQKYLQLGRLFCRYCGKRLPPEAIFCDQCGRRLE